MAINDRRASSLFPSYFEFVAEFRPRSVLIENVDGMLSAALLHRPLLARGKGYPPIEPSEQKGSFLRWFLEQIVGRPPVHPVSLRGMGRGRKVSEQSPVEWRVQCSL